MAIVFQKDKRSNITYAYESKSWWDKEKKQSRSKRTLIGRVDKETGKIVPTDGRCKKKKEKISKPEARRSFYGATYLFDEIGKKLRLDKDLKECFPDNYKKILSVAYFLILEENNSLSRFEKWSVLHKHPYNKNISSQRSSELFASISEESKERFFQLQGKRRIDKEYWAYDITSISSYSEQLKLVQYGKNKENDRLSQLNLALVFGEESGLPFYYRHFAGNIPDSKTIRNLLADLNNLGFKKVKLVMDRGFFSKTNVNMLYRNHLKFLMSAKISLSFIKSHLKPIFESFRSFENYNESYELYAKTVRAKWDYEYKAQNKTSITKSKKRIYIHYYFNIDKATEDEKSFYQMLGRLKKEIESGNRNPDNEKQYEKYFNITSTPKRGIKTSVKQDAVDNAKKFYGFFVLISNETMNAITALELYRAKDITEKGFANIKERLNMRRALVSSEQSLRGKLFVEFIALIYLSYIKKRMQEKEMFKKFTLQGLLDKLDLIECFEKKGRKDRIGEILEKQKKIFSDLGFNPPSSL